MGMKLETRLLSFFPTDDAPYFKAGKDSGGADGALACRRQSIPGKAIPFPPSHSALEAQRAQDASHRASLFHSLAV